MDVVTFHIQPIHPQAIMTPWILWPVVSSLHPLPLHNVRTFHIHPSSTTTTECCVLSHPAFIHYHYQMLWPFTSILYLLPLLNVVTFHSHPPSTTTTECCDLSRAACIHADPAVRLGSSRTRRCRRAVWSCCWSSLLLCGWGGRQSQTLSSLYSGGVSEPWHQTHFNTSSGRERSKLLRL